jgi:hypothetical protein
MLFFYVMRSEDTARCQMTKRLLWVESGLSRTGVWAPEGPQWSRVFVEEGVSEGFCLGSLERHSRGQGCANLVANQFFWGDQHYIFNLYER